MEYLIIFGLLVALVVVFKSISNKNNMEKQLQKNPSPDIKPKEKPKVRKFPTHEVKNYSHDKEEDITYNISIEVEEKNEISFKKEVELKATTKQALKINLSKSNPKNDFIKSILATKKVSGKFYTHGYHNSTHCIIHEIIDGKALGCLLFCDNFGNGQVERVFHLKINNEKIRFELNWKQFEYNIWEFVDEKEFQVNLFNYRDIVYKI